MLTKKFRRGFTLIELLVVIAVIAILAVLVFVALDPATRFADARNSRRWTDVTNISTAVHECIVDSGGVLATCGISAPLASAVLGSDVGNLDLSQELAAYLSSMPLDPSGGTAADTGYSIQVDANGIVVVSSDDEENSAAISVSR